MVIHKTVNHSASFANRVQKLQIKKTCKLHHEDCAPTWRQAKSERFLGRLSVQPDSAHMTLDMFLFIVHYASCSLCKIAYAQDA